MEKIQCFSPEVCEKIKYYVYRLIDPRTGQTFYVGKGKGNRVFAHVNCALKNYMGENFETEDDDNLKIQTIREIQKAGLNVIHIIQCWNLENQEAYLVESALMDCYPNLTNLQKGHYHEFGITNAYTLQRDLCIEQYAEPEDIDYLIIKTSEGRVNYCIEDYQLQTYQDGLYEATRAAWRLSLSKAQKYKYVLSVIGGIVKEVYEVEQWLPSEHEGRIEFEGHIAQKDIRDYFYNKRIPDKYVKKGAANPALYKK